jgi:hypothetical protein
VGLLWRVDRALALGRDIVDNTEFAAGLNALKATSLWQKSFGLTKAA